MLILFADDVEEMEREADREAEEQLEMESNTEELEKVGQKQAV